MREAGDQITELRPDIVACDLRLLDGHATRLAWEMRGWSGHRPQMLLLSTSHEDLRLFDALSAGADSYAADTGDGEGLAGGLRRLADRRAPMTARIAQQTLAAFGVERSRLAVAQLPTAGQDMASTGTGLSLAEQHLLSLLARGWLLAEIGERWLLQPAEIEQRLWRIYARLHARQPLLPAAQAAGGSVSMKLWRTASFS